MDALPSSSLKFWRFAAFQTAPASESLERDFLTLAATLSSQSVHPASVDILRVARGNGCSIRPLFGFQDFPGRGFGGVVQLPGEERPRAVLVGTREFMEESGLFMPDILEVAYRRWEEEGASLLVCGWDGHARGVMKFIHEKI